MTRQERIIFTLITIFFITLFPSWLRIVNIIVIGAIFISCFVFFPLREKLDLLRQRKSVQSMLLFFLLILLSFALSANVSKGLDYLVLQLPLLLFPISIGLIYLRPYLKNRILVNYAIITTLYCVICLATSTYAYLATHRGDAIYNDNLTSIIDQQSVYIAFLVNVAIYVYLHNILFKDSGYKFWMALAVVFLFGISYLLGSRINLAALVVMSMGLVFYYIISNRLLLEGLTLLLALVIGAFIILKLQPQMLNRYKELSYSKFDYESQGQESHYNVELSADQWNGANLRLAVWSCGWELFKENPILGVGLGDKKDELFEKYEQKNFHFAIKTNKNVHNNYLDILFSMGITGFAVFIIAWVALPITSAFKDGDSLALIIMLTLALAWITEIYLSRSIGGIIGGFFVPFLLTDKGKKEGQP